jgi:hypothetical protein
MSSYFVDVTSGRLEYPGTSLQKLCSIQNQKILLALFEALDTVTYQPVNQDYYRYM